MNKFDLTNRGIWQSVFVFSISNTESSYVRCYNFIKKVEKFETISEDDLIVENSEASKEIRPIRVKHKFVENINFADASHLKLFNVIKSDNNIQEITIIDNLNKMINEKSNKHFYFFDVNFSATDSITSLHYFLILRKEYDSKCFLCISTRDDSDYFRFSHYLLFESLAGMKYWESQIAKRGDERYLAISQKCLGKNAQYNQIYCYEKGKAKRLAIRDIGSLNRFIPTLNINRESFSVISKCVEDTFPSFQIFESNLYNDIDNDYLYKFQKSYFSDAKNLSELSLEDEENNSYYYNLDTNYEKKLYEIVIKDICIDLLVDSELLSLENENSNEEIYNICKKMSMMAFLFFSSFCKYISKKEKKKITESMQKYLIQESRDFADGILQVIENALEYAQFGYFNYRIFEKTNASKHDMTNYYLEISVTDMNTKADIVKTFIANLENSEDYSVNQILKTKLEQSISLRDFFDPSSPMIQDLWDEFYLAGNNATRHYGLQFFDSVVNASNGFFKVTSSTEMDISCDTQVYSHNYNCDYAECNIFSMNSHFPGTQYLVILPIKEIIHQNEVGIDITLDYSDKLLRTEWKENRISSSNELIELVSRNAEKLTLQNKEKNKKVSEISKLISRKFAKNSVLVIEVNSIDNMRAIEIFAKALIQSIISQNTDAHVGIIGCSDEFMINFTRCFSIFYNKVGKCNGMKNTQVYLCSSNYETEIVFAGNQIDTALYSAEYFANAKGVFNECLGTIEIILSKRAKLVKLRKRKRDIKILPFDLLIKENGITIFEQRVIYDLKRDIQEESFGCCLHDTHVRLGSKIHVIDDFYEVSLLFNSSMYTSRFAYLLSKKICKQISNKKILIVGYENYSELLIYELTKILNLTWNKDCIYTIFEQDESLKFRFLDSKMDVCDIVIIVPINSTLTTHGKIITELSKEMNIKNKNILNLAIILIRDASEKTEDGYSIDGAVISNNLTSIEKIYWELFDEKNKAVFSKNVLQSITQTNRINYIIQIESTWQEPITCIKCYPYNALNEYPIIHVNKSSVVPMTMIGLKGNNRKSSVDSTKLVSNIDLLKNVLEYRHLKRQDNHFQFYFKTEKLFQNIKKDSESENKFVEWIELVKNNLKEQKTKILREDDVDFIYDIIVAPANYSSAAFVEEINDKVFGNASLVINLDVDKEFRDNVVTKYSNLTSLYNNILLSNRKAAICFYYVDDTIVSGSTFHRGKSLIHSLFPDQAYLNNSPVKIKLFKSVIILINRNSKSSINNYVENDMDYFSFINLNIPSMRNHRDACTLCTLDKDYRELLQKSSTNAMANYWNRKIFDNKVQESNSNMNNRKNQGSYFYRLECTHNAFTEINALNLEKDNSDKVKTAIIRLINQKIGKDNCNTDNEKIEYVISYIKVFSRPFLSFRKSVLEAIFSIMTYILEYFLCEEDARAYMSTLENDIEETCNETFNFSIQQLLLLISRAEKSAPNEIRSLFMTLISRLSSLGSKYIIRTHNMNRIVKYSSRFSDNNFSFWYAMIIKKLVILSRDEAVSLWIEYLIMNKHEIGDSKTILSVDNNFLDMVYYENTSIQFDAIEEIYYKRKNGQTEVLSEYYFEYFRRILNLIYFEEYFDPGSLNEEKWDDVKNSVEDMVEFYTYLMNKSNEKREIASYYEDMLEKTKKIVGAESISMCGIEKQNDILFCYPISWQKEKPDCDVLTTKLQSKDLIGDTINNYESSTIVIFDNNIINGVLKDANKEKFDNILLEIEYSKNICDRKRGIRNLLVFRKTLVKIFQNDFSNNLFKSNDYLLRQNELLGIDKAGSHTPSYALEDVYKQIISVENYTEIECALASRLLLLAADSLISKIYRDITAERIKKEGELGIGKLLALNINILNDITYRREYNSRTNPTKANVTISDDVWEKKCRFMPGQQHYITYFIVSLIQNAVRYGGLRDNENIVDIAIEVEGKYIRISNKTYKYPNNDNGISVKAIMSYFKIIYNEELIVDETDKLYVIKLPIVKE